MTDFTYPSSIPLHIPDNLTLPQFILDTHHPARVTKRLLSSPWLIEDATGRGMGFEEARHRVYGLANGLKLKYNVAEGQAVCLFTPNDIDYPILIWGIHRLGAIVTAANPAYSADELAYQLSTAKAVNLITHPDFLATAFAAAKKAGVPAERLIILDSAHPSRPSSPVPTVEEIIAYGLSQPTNFVERHLSPGEAKTKLAFLSFSSGTTGKPKAVAISHYAPIANVIQMAIHQEAKKEERIKPGDVALGALPFFHIYGLVVQMHFSIFCGMPLVVIPKFDYVRFLESLIKYRITHLFLVPPQVVLLCKHQATPKYDLSHVRFVMCGAAPLSAELTQEVIKVLPNAAIGQGYGMTETCTTVTMFSTKRKIAVFGSAGTPLPGTTLRVLKPDGTFGKVGEQGELLVHSPSNALRYANNEEATKETFLDGWVRTGDEVIIQEDGEVFIELLKVRGFQVAPAELEGHILQHPDVADTCVIGILDEYSGELPMAYVVLRPEAAKRAAISPAESEKFKASIIKAWFIFPGGITSN
ncbi:amp dependent CoA ligase [Dentipellis sp. KUC8613]|nr:amp dependent CoA ligase [Dentipellis sp. KUC8613]